MANLQFVEYPWHTNFSNHTKLTLKTLSAFQGLLRKLGQSAIPGFTGASFQLDECQFHACTSVEGKQAIQLDFICM